MKKAFLVGVLIIALFIIIQLFGALFFQQREDVIELEFSPELEYRFIEVEEQGIHKFEAKITESDFKQLDSNYYSLIINNFNAQWYKVYFNEQLIGRLGDLDRGRSNIWNAIAKYEIDKDLIEEENDIKIKAFVETDIGLEDFPIIITTHTTANKILNYYEIFIGNLNYIVAGLLAFAILLLVFAYILSKKNKKEYLYYALTAFFLLIHLSNYFVIHNYIIPYDYFRKIVVSALHIGFGFYSLAYYEQFKEKTNLILAILIFVFTSYGVVFSNDLIEFYNFISLLLVIFIINTLYCSYVSVKKYDKSYNIKTLILINLALLFDGFNFITNRLVSIDLYFITVFVYPISIMLLVIYNYINTYNKMIQEKNKANQMYNRVIRDEMTGIYNYNYVVNKINNEDRKLLIALFDVDDFKEVNDNYGHLAGDKILKSVANRLQDNLRGEDIAARYGGDEFIVVIFAVDLTAGIKIINRLRKKLSKPYIISDEDSLEINISLGAYHSDGSEEAESVIEKADQALYNSKNNDKGELNIYNN